MANKLFLDTSFIRIMDVYDNYIKRHNDYCMSFEQFYMSLYQKKIELYFHTHNIGIKAGIAIFSSELKKDYPSKMEFPPLFSNKYEQWYKDNETIVNSIHKTLEKKVNSHSLGGGIFFKLNYHSYMDIKMGTFMSLDFLPLDLYSIDGEAIFNHDEAYTVCEQYFHDTEMPSINIAPTEFVPVIGEYRTVPELQKNNDTGGYNFTLSEKDIFIQSDDAIEILNNKFYGGIEPESQETIEKIKPVGVSKEKIEAKRYARNIAEYLWSQDKNEEIKIGQMCENVYSALFETKHKSQLPDQVVSIRSWIKDIAPSYASEAGRSKD